METVVAKTISVPDIEYMYDNENRPGTCPVCHNTLEKIPDIHYKVAKKKADILLTYDGYYIVTEKFKAFCKENKYSNVCFTKLTDSTGYYFFMPQDIYILDYIHRKTGTKGCKDPLIIIGLETEQKMKAFGIKGVSYINVYSIETIYGKSKPIDEVTLQDMQENPIWIFALDEEDSDEVDESWLKPILKSDNVMSEFVEAYILLKSTDGQYYISANLDIKKEVLDDVTFWKPEQQCWIPIENIDSYKEMQFIAVPKIEKETDILFGFDSSKNLFSSLRSQAQLKEKKKTIFSFFASLFKRK